MRIETDIRVARSPEEVFDLLADQAAWGKIDEALVDYSPHTTLALGTAGTASHRRFGLIAKTRWEVTAFDRGTLFEGLITGMGYRLRETIALVADVGGTHVTVVNELLPTSLAGRLFVALSRGTIERDLARRSVLMKALLEVTTPA